MKKNLPIPFTLAMMAILLLTISFCTLVLTNPGYEDDGDYLYFSEGGTFKLSSANEEGAINPYDGGAGEAAFRMVGQERLVMAMPFRDRVVQHSLCDFVLEPILDRHLITANSANDGHYIRWDNKIEMFQ